MKRCIKSTRSVRATGSVIIFKTASKEPGRRKGGKGDFYDGGKRGRNSKRQAFVICYCLSSSQRNEPKQRPFNVLRSLKQYFIFEKIQKSKILNRDKKKKRHYFRSNSKPFQVAHIIGHEWDGITHVHVCRLCQSCNIPVSFSSLSLKGGSRETKAHKGTEGGRLWPPCLVPRPFTTATRIFHGFAFLWKLGLSFSNLAGMIKLKYEWKYEMDFSSVIVPHLTLSSLENDYQKTMTTVF